MTTQSVPLQVRRNVLAVLLFAGIVSLAGAVVAQTTPKVAPDTTVYVTKTGTKYHTAGCRSLSKSKIPISLADASKKYGACSICKPPVLSTESAASESAPRTSSPATASPSAPATKSTQCAATTKKGTRCSRTASAGSAYCWQHGGYEALLAH